MSHHARHVSSLFFSDRWAIPLRRSAHAAPVILPLQKSAVKKSLFRFLVESWQATARHSYLTREYKQKLGFGVSLLCGDHCFSRRVRRLFR